MAHNSKNEKTVIKSAVVDKTVVNHARNYVDILNKLLWPALITYAMLVIVGIINHESWADEAQPWLIARDSSFVNIFNLLPSEGHPPLWYILLFPFAKLGLPFETVKVLSAVVMISAVYLLLFKTKVHPALKLAFPFSYYIAYQYSVIGRSYCLILLFILLIAWLYPRRFEKPWLYALCVVGLFNTHMLAFSFAFGVVILFITDAVQQKMLNTKTSAAIVFMLIGGLYLVPYFSGSVTAQYFLQNTTDHTTNIINALGLSLFMTKATTGIGLAVYHIPLLNFSSVLFVLLTILIVPRTKALLLMLAGVAGIFYIIAYRYSYIQPRHFGVLFFVVAGAYFISIHYAEDSWNMKGPAKYDLPLYGQLLLALACIAQVPVTLNCYYIDATRPYSGSKDVAAFLTDNNLEHRTIVAYNAWSTLPILPYLPREVRFYNPACERYNTYCIYDSCYERDKHFKPQQTIKVAYNQFKGNLRDVLMICNFGINLEKVKFLEKIYESPEVSIYNQETYFIYKFKADVK